MFIGRKVVKLMETNENCLDSKERWWCETNQPDARNGKFLEITNSRIGIFPERQFGFRRGMNTVSAVGRLVKKIKDNKRNDRHTVCFTLVIANALNTVGH